jgi:N6-adenosine-specific RNA methylase IME4
MSALALAMRATPDTWHEYANLFPMLSSDTLAMLSADIAEHGIREPVMLYQGKVLDGRNRCLAANDIGIDVPTRDFVGDDAAALAFVISTNLHRRHLTESQRASIAARLANMRVGKPANPANLPLYVSQSVAPPPVSQSEAASLLNVSERSVRTARKVQEHGAPELVAAVDSGMASVSAAAEIAQVPHDQQREIVAKGEKEILAAAKAIRAEKAVISRGERLQKIDEISRGNTALDTSTKYPVVYADPPWRYENPPMGAGNRAIENHYPTMTLEEICAMPIAELAADDAMLYLWATAPKLAECLEVVKAWGFEYRTNIVWDKEKIGMGYHARNQHEILLICKRGNIPPPQAGKQPSSVHREARTAHSAKPLFYYEMIEEAYSGLQKIELFCRSPRQGWAVWGNQSGDAE